MRDLRVNRGDPHAGCGPFGNLVKGEATVIAPNSTVRSTFSGIREDATGAYVEQSYCVPDKTWVGGNRSGE